MDRQRIAHEMLHPADRTMAKSRLKRRSVPIHAYLGSGNGSGKSLAMVHDTLPSLERGRPVLSTVRLLDYLNPRPCDDPTCTFPGHPNHMAAHPLWIPLKSYQQMLDARDCDILLDEVTGVANSRSYASLPVAIANMLVQLRRRNCALRWTATNWSRCDVLIREVTQMVTLSIPHIAIPRKSEPGEPPMLWTDKQLFLWRSYSAALMDDFDARGADDGEMRSEITQVYWRPGAFASQAYDTLDPVLALGAANDLGMCITCGGKRIVPKCACDDHVTEPRRRTPTIERVTLNLDE